MTLLAVLFSYIVIAAVLPFGLAGPACAKKNYQQQQCIERCKGKWGYPGFVMGTNAWGSVIQPSAVSAASWDSMVSQACGMQSSSSSSATPVSAPVGAIGNAPPSLSSSLVSSSTQTTSSSSTSVRSSSSIVSSSSSSSSFSTSSSPKPTSTSSTPSFAFSFETATSTSSENFAPPSPTSSPEPAPEPSTTEEHTTSTPPPPPPTTSSTPPPAPTTTQDASSNSGGSSGNSGNSGSTSDSDIQAYLSAHNSIRAQHGASPLTWSDEAAGKAQQWANNCVFKHSGGSLGPFGENLAAGTGDSYDIAAAVKSWTDEVKDYDPNNPQPSHFTQVVWKATSQVGCALQLCDGIFAASFGKAKFFVCEYSVQGNVIGQFAENVQA